MRPITVSRTLAAAVVNSVSVAQTSVAAADFTITGALASGGVATIPVPARLTLTSAGDISGVNFTLTGTDYMGRTISEVIAGPNINTVTSVNTYATVTTVHAGGAVGTATSVGTSQSGASPVVPLDQYLTPFNVTLGLEITATANATVQYTVDNVFDIAAGASLDSLTWNNHSDLTSKTSSTVGTLISPVSAVRLFNNSGSGATVLRVSQAGVAQ